METVDVRRKKNVEKGSDDVSDQVNKPLRLFRYCKLIVVFVFDQFLLVIHSPRDSIIICRVTAATYYLVN